MNNLTASNLPITNDRLVKQLDNYALTSSDNKNFLNNEIKNESKWENLI